MKKALYTRVLPGGIEVIIVPLVRVLDLLAMPHGPEEGAGIEYLHFVRVPPGKSLGC